MMEFSVIKIDKGNLLKPLPEFEFVDCWIAGGAVRDSIVNVKFSDIDVFGKNKEALDKFIESNLKGCKKVYDTEKLKTFYKNGDKIQVIYYDYVDIAACLDSFDFTLCQFAFDGINIHCNPQSILDLHRNKIVVHKLIPKFAVSSLRRVQKYIQKGFTICDGGLKDFVTTIREAEQTDVDSQFDFYPDGRARVNIRFD